MTLCSELFLAGCVLEDAQYVAVTATTKKVETHLDSKLVVKLMTPVYTAIHRALMMLYSDKSQNRSEGLHIEVTYCKVSLDSKTGSRYFNFRFRRYIHDTATNKFIPGCWNDQHVAIREWLDSSYMHQGLSNEEAAKRLGIVGRNVLELKKPTIVSSIFHEFSKPFYLYQNFLVWTWGKIPESFATIFSLPRHAYICTGMFSTILVLLHGHHQYFHSSYWWPCGCGVSVHE